MFVIVVSSRVPPRTLERRVVFIAPITDILGKRFLLVKMHQAFFSSLHKMVVMLCVNTLCELHLSLLSTPLLTVTIGLSLLFPSQVFWLFVHVLSLLRIEETGLF